MKAKRKPKGQAPDCPETGKRSFYSHDSAKFFMGAYRAKRFYRCPFCDHWHLTTKAYTGKKNNEKN